MRDTSHRDTLQSGFQRNVKLRITQAIKLKPRSVDGRRCIIFQLLAARYPSSTRSWEEMLGRCLSRESHAREQKRRSGGKRARSDSLTRRGSEDRIVGKSEQRVTYGSRYGSAAELMLRPRMRFRTRLRLVIGHNRKLRLRCNAITKWQTVARSLLRSITLITARLIELRCFRTTRGIICVAATRHMAYSTANVVCDKLCLSPLDISFASPHVGRMQRSHYEEIDARLGNHRRPFKRDQANFQSLA